MASKVNNSTAQKKWDSLKGSAGVSLTRIVQGQASSSDFQRVQNVLSQQSTLASQVFNQALGLAQKQAEKFQSSYQALRDKDDRQILSQFEVALNAELQKVTPDIVGQIKEFVEMSVTSSRDDLDKSITGKFEAFQELLPKEKDVPTIHDMLVANDLLAIRIQEDSERAWANREPALLEKIAHVFEGTLRNLAERVQQARAHQARPHRQQLALPAPSSGGHQLALAPVGAGNERPSILSQGMSMLRGPSDDVIDVDAKDVTHRGSSGSSTMVVALAPAAQHQLVTAAQEQKDFYSRVKDLLPSAGMQGHGEAEEEGKEEKKADTWWRSFKNWFGGDAEDKKKKKSDKFEWIKSLGAMLALMILNPKLFQSIGQGLKNLLTWENLRAAADKSLDWVKGVTSSLMEAIANMLGGTMKTPTQAEVTDAKDGKKDLATTETKKGDTKHADLNHLTPEQKKQYDAMGKANHESSEGPGFLNKAFQAIGYTTPAMKDYNMAHTDSNPKSPTYGHIIIDGADKGKNPDFKPKTSVTTAAQSAGSGRSSVNPPLPPTMPTGADASTTFSESPSVKYTPGVSLPMNDPSTPAGGAAAMMPQKGAPQIGIGSFGFNAANSDSLTLMNTYHFTAG